MKSQKDSSGHVVRLPRNEYLDLKYTKFSKHVTNVKLYGNADCIDISIPFEDNYIEEPIREYIDIEDKHYNDIDVGYIIPMSNVGYTDFRFCFEADTDEPIDVTFDTFHIPITSHNYYPFWVTIKDILRANKEEIDTSINEITDPELFRARVYCDTYIFGGKYASRNQVLIKINTQPK